VVGFPPGTTAEMVHTTWHGVVQDSSRGVSTLLLLTASGLFAGWAAGEGRRGWAAFLAAGIPGVFLALTLFQQLTIGGNPVALAFLLTPWVWLTALAAHFYRNARVAA